MKEVFGKHEEGMKLADLHVHTNLSPDSRGGGLDPEELVDLVSETDLSVVAVTDHHIISGAEIAKEYAAKNKKPIEIVTGIEISTDKGHIVGLYVREPVSSVRLEQVIYDIHRQGGLVIVPHPFLRTAGRRPLSLSEEALNSVIFDDSWELYFDGFEVYSQGAQDIFHARGGSGDNTNRLSLEYYSQHKEKLGAAISSSDSHGITVGRSRTAYHGNLGKAIEEGNTVALELSLVEQGEIYDAATTRFGIDRGRQGKLGGRLRAFFENQQNV